MNKFTKQLEPLLPLIETLNRDVSAVHNLSYGAVWKLITIIYMEETHISIGERIIYECILKYGYDVVNHDINEFLESYFY